MTVIAAVLWIWLAVSVSVYGYRIYRRISRGPHGSGEAAAPTESDRDRSDGLGAASMLIQNPLTGFDAPPAVAPPTTSEPATEPGTAQPGTAPGLPVVAPLDAPLTRAEMMPPTPNPPDPQVQPVWTAPAPGDLPASERRTARQPISEAVTGIRLPCDLAPLVGDASRIDPYDVAFFTTTHDGDSVRGALAGELVRLGYQVATTSAFRLGASRADAEIAVTIYPSPTAATEAGRTLFPTAAADSVVVRFQS